MDKLLKLLDLLIALEIKKIILIGGEPTCDDDLFEIVAACRERNFSVALVTNGVKLSDVEYVSKLKHAGVNNVRISLKGYSRENYIEGTGTDGFVPTLLAINNLAKYELSPSVSMVLTQQNVGKFVEGVKKARDSGANHFSFSFYYDFSVFNNNACVSTPYDFDSNIFDIISIFISQYDKLSDVTAGKFVLSQSFPLCAWPEHFIAIMREKQQLRSVCQLLKHSGLVFDSDLNVIPCNAMYKLVLGKFGVDFHDRKSFMDFWHSEDTSDVFNKLRSIPSLKCLECKSLSVCGGGCVSHWFNFTFNEFERARDRYFEIMRVKSWRKQML
jgi:radical SAM protein with 4Fe4S-binding SPASM domain